MRKIICNNKEVAFHEDVEILICNDDYILVGRDDIYDLGIYSDDIEKTGIKIVIGKTVIRLGHKAKR